MDLAKEILLLFCVVFFASQCSTTSDREQLKDACIVQYLKAKGKLNETFQSTVPTPSTTECENVVPSEDIKRNLKYEFKRYFPNEGDCLANQFHYKEAIDNHMQIMVIRSSSFLSESVKDTQLADARNQYKNVLKEIAVLCLVDDKNFIQIFDYMLGIENNTFEACE